MCELQVKTDGTSPQQHSAGSILVSKWHGIWMSVWLLCIFVLGQKPIHLDEANFLAMTHGDWWSPHNIQINWEGTTESAFDVLSNPPGMPWLLFPVRNSAVWTMRLWMLPWVLLSIWGTWKCLQVQGSSIWNLWLMVLSPLFALSHNSLMPEMPLYACIVLGWQGLLRKKSLFGWGLILGCAALFRYSGLTMIPLVLGWIILHRPKNGWWGLLGVCIPTVFLYMHDVMVYEEWHFLHMISFQQDDQSISTMIHKVLAMFSMLVLGVGAIPRWSKPKRKGVMLLCALITTLVLSRVAALDLTLLACTSVSIGIVVFWTVCETLWSQKKWWMLCWVVGGVFFLLNLRFAATRYWLPFALPYWLMWNPRLSGSKMWCWVLGFLSLHLVWDDAQLAKSQYTLAEEVTAHCFDEYQTDKGYFAGHWGWQYALQDRGWTPSENDSKIPNNVCFVKSFRSWPQESSNECWYEEVLFDSGYRSLLLPIRVHTIEGQGNYHSYMISNDPPIRTITPFGWGVDSWDQALFRRSCLR